MGKYMRRKSKTSTEVSLMEVPSLPGVLTRAKTLALQKAATSSSYIQLRSRRLVKPNSPNKHNSVSTNPSNLPLANPSRFNLHPAVSLHKFTHKDHEQVHKLNHHHGDDDDDEASFGENILEIEGRERTTRETTPCSLIRDPDAIKAPGSSTKSRRHTGTKYSVEDTSRHIPSTSEMDEFFTGPEKQQQRLFIEKYNFDPVNDKPLPGRYEWVKLDATKKS